MELPLDARSLDLVWTVLGRLPAVAVLLALTWEARRAHGTRAALLGASGFTAGAMLGTALLPSIVGALGGGVVGALVTWRILGARWPAPGRATALLLGLVAVGRWGCFVSGCCFGRVTDSSWGVTYGPHSFAHLLHERLGLVGALDAALPVVPVQALESLGLALLVLAGVALRRRLSEGATSLVLVGGALVLRAAVDPLRAMVNTPSSVAPGGPLSVFQWGVLLVAAACFAGAWRVQRRPLRFAAPRLAAPWVFPVVWLAQALVALAAEPQGTWLLRVLAVSASAASAALLLVEWESARRLRPAFAAAALTLLLPVATRAGDGPSQPRDWLYVVHPKSERLVRVGTASQPRALLVAQAQAILAEDAPAAPPAEVPPAGPVPTAPPLLPTEDAPEPPPEVLRDVEVRPVLAPEDEPPTVRDSLTLTALGGRQGYFITSCSGGSSGLFDYGEVSAQYEHHGVTSNVTMFRARLLGGAGSGGTAGSGTLAGLYELHWRYGSFGLGAALALSGGGDRALVAQSGYLNPDAARFGGLRVGLWPLIYGRVEAIRGFAFELGTGSRFQPQEGVFVNLRAGLDEPGKWAVRLGLESTWLNWPLANTNLFLDMGFPLAATHRLHLRLQGHPGPGAALGGGVRWSWDL